MKKSILISLLTFLFVTSVQAANQAQCKVNLINTSPLSVQVSFTDTQDNENNQTAMLAAQGTSNMTLNVLCNQLGETQFNIAITPMMGGAAVNCNLKSIPEDQFQASLTIVVGIQEGSKIESCNLFAAE